MTSREAFEAWRNPGKRAGNVSAWVAPGRYENDTHQLAWLAWQAAYEAGRTAERAACALEKDLMREVLQVADAGFLPDGSLADTPTFMWSEEWQRKYQTRGKP